jgi:hypothetical protein
VKMSRYAAAARFFDRAFKADAKMSQNLKVGYRYEAACAAALAGLGKGRDTPPPSDDARVKLRSDAHAWLEGDLRVFHTLLERKISIAPGLIQAKLRRWKVDPRLYLLRDGNDLADPERASWHDLWTRVEGILTETRNAPPPGN